MQHGSWPGWTQAPGEALVFSVFFRAKAEDLKAAGERAGFTEEESPRRLPLVLPAEGNGRHFSYSMVLLGKAVELALKDFPLRIFSLS